MQNKGQGLSRERSLAYDSLLPMSEVYCEDEMYQSIDCVSGVLYVHLQMYMLYFILFIMYIDCYC